MFIWGKPLTTRAKKPLRAVLMVLVVGSHIAFLSIHGGVAAPLPPQHYLTLVRLPPTDALKERSPKPIAANSANSLITTHLPLNVLTVSLPNLTISAGESPCTKLFNPETQTSRAVDCGTENRNGEPVLIIPPTDWLAAAKGLGVSKNADLAGDPNGVIYKTRPNPTEIGRGPMFASDPTQKLLNWESGFLRRSPVGDTPDDQSP